MAAITVDERLVKLVRVDEPIPPAVSGAALDAGIIASQDANGKYVPGVANATRRFILETVLTANAPVSPLRKGIVDLGGTVLSARAPGTPVYATAAGVLDDAATGNTLIGYVEQGRGDLDGEGVNRKYLRVDL